MDVCAVHHLILLLNLGTRLSNENDSTEVTVRWRDRPKWWLIHVWCEQEVFLVWHCSIWQVIIKISEKYSVFIFRGEGAVNLKAVHSYKTYVITYQTSAIPSRHVHLQYRGIYGPTLRHTCGKVVNCISALCIVFHVGQLILVTCEVL